MPRSFLASLRSICVVLFLKVAAAAPMRRRMLLEAGRGPGGSSPTSRGTPSLVSARCSLIPQTLSYTDVSRSA